MRTWLQHSIWAWAVLCAIGMAQAPAPLIQNGDFASHARKPGAPDFWQTFAHEGQYTVAIDKTAKPCLKVEGRAEAAGGRAGAFQKTPVFDAPAGLRFTV